MNFRLLGPLEVLHEGRPLALGGIKQRATLGFLLLKANEVVPTSQLVEALWPSEDPPISARKMLQNAVWSLRTALSVIDGPGAPRLVTQAPGYMLRVDPEQIDLFQFQQQAERGRAASARPEQAAVLLHEALGMWRGAALADLVESGISWPELAVVTNARLDAMEDYFDAELACGRHQSVLGKLEATVEAEPLRERACGQLMLALYRCGRHADALALYCRLRTSLVEDLGLEPGPALQELQHAILTHDPALTLPRPVTREVAPVGQVEPIPRQRHAPTPQRQRVSLAMVRVGLGADFANADPAEVDHALAAVTSKVRAGIEELGGTVATSIGSASLAVFGGPYARGNDEERAVRAALALRDYFSGGMGRKLVAHIAVVTGKALMRSESDSAPIADGRLVDQCHQLLSAVPDGAVWIGERTHAMTASTFTATPGTLPGAWQVESTRDGEDDSGLDGVRDLLGEATEFLSAFERSVDTPTLTDRDAAPAQVIACHPGVPPEDLYAVRATLAEKTRRLCRTERQSDRLTSMLLSLLDPNGIPTSLTTSTAVTSFLAGRIITSDDVNDSDLDKDHIALSKWRGRDGDVAGTVEELEHVLVEAERALGAIHQLTLSARSNLANWRFMSGDVERTMAEFDRLFTTDSTRLLGAADPSTLVTSDNLTLLRELMTHSSKPPTRHDGHQQRKPRRRKSRGQGRR